MSEPAEFALIRNQKVTYYTNRWAADYVVPRLMWGQDYFLKWLELECYETGEWDGCGERDGAVVDLDNKRVTWRSENELQEVSRFSHCVEKLLAEAWPEFDVQFVEYYTPKLAEAHGWDSTNWVDDDAFPITEPPAEPISSAALCDAWYSESKKLSAQKIERQIVVEQIYMNEAGGVVRESITEADIEVRANQFAEDELRTWVTIVLSESEAIQLQTYEIPGKLLRGDLGFVDYLKELRPCEVPAELVVSEGLIIDAVNQSIHVWGKPDVRRFMPKLRFTWPEWKVNWLDGGYDAHCKLTGVTGQAWTDLAALTRVANWVLVHDDVGPSGEEIRKHYLHDLAKRAGYETLE